MKRRIAWNCKRGTLELDLMLKKYISTRIMYWDKLKCAEFIELLKLDDRLLYEEIKKLVS